MAKKDGIDAGTKAVRTIMDNTESANEARVEIRAAINVLKGARSKLVKGKEGKKKYRKNKNGFFSEFFG